MIPLWVSWGGGSQFRLMVLFFSWLTDMDTASGGAPGTACNQSSSWLFSPHVRVRKQTNRHTCSQIISHLSLELSGAECYSLARISCCHRDELWTRTCSLSLRGPLGSGSLASSPSLLPSLSWQAAKSDTEPQSHRGNVFGLGGTGAGQRGNAHQRSHTWNIPAASETLWNTFPIPSIVLGRCWTQRPWWWHFPESLAGLTALCEGLFVQCWQPLETREFDFSLKNDLSLWSYYILYSASMSIVYSVVLYVCDALPLALCQYSSIFNP